MSKLEILMVCAYLVFAALFLKRRPWLSRVVYQSNANRKFGESPFYYRTTVLVETTGKRVVLLMTPSEFATILARTEKQPEEIKD